MLYTRKSFTLPAATNTSQMKWDFAFLNADEFMVKYNLNISQYEVLKTTKF